MKNKFLAFAIFLSFGVFPISGYAQLTVDSNGDVKISKKLAIESDVSSSVALNIEHMSTSSTPFYGLKAHIKTAANMPTSSIYGVYSYADGSLTTGILSSSPIVGVFGLSTKHNGIISNFSAGVAGMAHYCGGIGVYGAISGGANITLPTIWKNAAYSGYFDGTVKINGTLIATTVSTTSDERFKDNIQTIPASVVNNLQSLNPVSYTLKQDSAWKYDKDAKELQGIHYGLIAQDVQKIYPELVYERGEQLSINYIELIPLLIKEIQNLSAEVANLKAQKVQPQTHSSSGHTNGSSFGDQATLYQNNPNPFSIDTRIDYQLPQNTQSATLYIYNMNGLQVAEYPITSYGSGSVVVNGGYLEAGMYLYSLVADNQIIDTKRMILTK